MKAYEWSGLRYGAAYYNEYHQERITDEAGNELAARTEEDFRLMSEAGVTVIRVGESVWARWQPEPNRFDLDWLEPILDRAHANGIGVILGTPTYAVPRWVFIDHPSVIAHHATGAPVAYGHRQNVDYSSVEFRALCEPLITKIVERYASHPSIIGWQIDNEPGAYLLHNDGVFNSFKDSLRDEYGSIDGLNAAWGLTYWSHALRDFEDLWRPDGNTNPSYLLAWRKHQARLTNEFLQWQRDLVRKLIAPGQFITTCVAINRPGMDTFSIGESLDATSVNVYYASQDGLEHPTRQPSPGVAAPAPIWVPLTGASALNLICDTARGIKQENFLVTETNGSSISQGPAMAAFPHYPGQFKQAALNMVSRGAELVEYWHWHTLPYGVENYWGGILPHSLKPGRTYAQFAETAVALRAIESLGRLTPAAEVAIVYSTSSLWAFEFQGSLRQPNGMVDPKSYERTLQSLYEIAYSAGLGVRLIGETQLDLGDPVGFAAQHPALILHAYAASDELLEFARAYAAAGGRLILPPRTGYVRLDGVMRTEVAPAGFAVVLGASYNEYSNLNEPVAAFDISGNTIGAGYGWIDELELTADSPASVLARLDHPFFGQFAAVAEAPHGAGSITYLASYPDAALSVWLGERLARQIGHKQPLVSQASSVITNRAKTADGRDAYFVFNWSWTPAEASANSDVADLLTGENFRSGQTFALGAWGVRVLLAN